MREGPDTSPRGASRAVLTALVLLCACAALQPGCRRSNPAADTHGPADLVNRLRVVRQERRYKELELLVEPKGLATLVRTLMAVDRLLTASGQLQEAAEKHVGPTAAVVCNLNVLADFLGPFSRNVRVVSVRVEGDKATVAYQVGDRVPIERAELRRSNGRWRYVPDDADEKLPNLLLQLTEQLVALRAEAESGRYAEPAFIKEYRRRIQEPLAAHLAERDKQRKQTDTPAHR